jgi:spore germination protein YaaH
MPSSRRRRALRLLLTLIFLLGADWLLLSLVPPSRPRAPVRDENGLWLRSGWYRGEHSNAEIQALAARLASDRMTYAYFHVRHIQADGTLRFHCRDEARRVTSQLRMANRGIKPIAWIYAGNRGDGGLPKVDLSDPQVRSRMVQEGVWLVRECGFSGVQWDYEVCADQDPAYPHLLHETREALRFRQGIVGACTAVWSPRPFPGWSRDYFMQMALESDQLAVMAYDTGLYWPRAYRWLVSEQVRQVLPAVRIANPRCRVLIGLPTYSRGGLAHSAWSENLVNGLAGVRDGIASGTAGNESFAGVALFADYTTQPAEWRDYRRLWLGL